jgi:hypothetical protein
MKDMADEPAADFVAAARQLIEGWQKRGYDYFVTDRADIEGPHYFFSQRINGLIPGTYQSHSIPRAGTPVRDDSPLMKAVVKYVAQPKGLKV